MIGIELVDPETQEPATDLTKTVAAEVNRLGVVVLTCGTSGNVIRLLPARYFRRTLVGWNRRHQ